MLTVFDADIDINADVGKVNIVYVRLHDSMSNAKILLYYNCRLIPL